MKTWLFNVILGFSAFLFTFFFSIINNTLETSLLRAAMGFILFFVLAYALRYVLAQKNIGTTTKPGKIVETFSESEKENDVNELEQEEMSFQAISLGSLHNGADSKNPNIISDITRTWASQNQEG